MTITKKLAIGTAGVLAVAGTGSALAAAVHGKKASARPAAATLGFAGHHGAGGDDLAAAADYLGVTNAALMADLQSGKTLAQVAAATSGKTTAGLIAALVAHETTEISAAVTAGRLTQAQADTQIAGLTARFTAAVASTGPLHGPGDHGGPGGPGDHGGPGGPGDHGGPGGPGDHGGPGHGPSDDLAAAATYLGVTGAVLQSDLQSGKTLAQVAAATSGKTTAGLIDALVTHETAELKAAVTAGRLTQAQADTMTAGLSARFTDFVNGVPPAGGPPGAGWGGPGH